MNATEIGHSNTPPEQLIQSETQAVQAECTEACQQLGREICLDNLLNDLAIECSTDKRPLLIASLIDREKTLPKLLTDFPPAVAKIHITKALSSLNDTSAEQALEKEDNAISELTQANQKLDEEHEQDKTTIDVSSETNEKKVHQNDRLEALKKLQTEKQAEGLKGQALLKALAMSDIAKDSPELQKLLANFNRILTLAQNEQDKAVLEAKVSSVDFASMPDPVMFIQEQVLDDPNISEATQQAIAREFNITPYKVVTGSDVDQSFAVMTLDPETGETKPRFTQDNPLEYRPGIAAYNGESGENYLQFNVDPPVRYDVRGWSPDAIADLSEYGALFVGFQQAGVSNFMVHNFHLPNALSPQFDPLDASKSRQIVDALLGFNQGYDGKIYGADKTEYFQWFVQMLSPRGDWAQGDFDVNASNQALKNLGIKDDNGQLNLEVLESVGSYARGIYGSGAPDYYALQKHLNEIYGERIPLDQSHKNKQDA